MRRLILLVGFFTTTPVLVIFSSLFLLFLTQQKTTGLLGLLASENRPFAYAALPNNLNVVSDSVIEGDARVGKVSAFLENFNSPLTQYSSLIVNLADKYGIDYRLLPAIAAQESGACQKEIPGTHNCWGFGIYGKKITTFDDYESAMDRVTRYFANKKSNGIDTLEEIGAIYNPTDHNNWKANVASFMNQM